MQCRNELKGIKIYTETFSKCKDIKQVDAITGATWSHDLLKSTYYITLEKAKQIIRKQQSPETNIYFRGLLYILSKD